MMGWRSSVRVVNFETGGGGAFLLRVCRILLVGRLADHRVWAVFIACCCWERITGFVFDTYIAVIGGFETHCRYSFYKMHFT